MQQWEYFRKKDLSDIELAQLGNEGWELVAATVGTGTMYIFKRPKNITISTEHNQSNSSTQLYTQRKEWTMEEMFPGIEK